MDLFGLSIDDCRFAKCRPTAAAQEHASHRPKPYKNPKDVKNEGRPGNVYENKGSTDTMTENYSGFCAWSAPFLPKLTKIQRAFWPNMQKSDDKCGEAGTDIGSSRHRPIDPSAEPVVALRWPNDPLTRWADHLVFPLCNSKQKGLAKNIKNPSNGM